MYDPKGSLRTIVAKQHIVVGRDGIVGSSRSSKVGDFRVIWKGSYATLIPISDQY